MGGEEGRMREEGGCKITSTTTTLGKLWSYYPVKVTLCVPGMEKGEGGINNE